MNAADCFTFEGDVKTSKTDSTLIDASACPGGCAANGICKQTEAECSAAAAARSLIDMAVSAAKGLGVILIVILLVVAVIIGLCVYCCCCRSKDDNDYTKVQ